MEVHIRPMGGLANRMRVLASAKALAEREQAELIIHWECNKSLNCAYSDLFETVDGLKLIEYAYLKSWQRRKKRQRAETWQSLRLSSQVHWDDEAVLKLKEQKSDVMKLASGLTKLYIETCQHFYGDPSFISYLRPNDELKEQLSIRKQKLPTSYLGIHLRRGDNQLAVKESPLVVFTDWLDKQFRLNPNSSLFLATDDPKIAAELRKRYPNRLHYFEHLTDRTKPLAIKQAFLDFLILADSEEIHGSFYSSFSEEAAHYGGIGLKVLRKHS